LLWASQGLALVVLLASAARCSSSSSNVVGDDNTSDDGGGATSSGNTSSGAGDDTSSSGSPSSSGTTSGSSGGGGNGSASGVSTGGGTDASFDAMIGADGGCVGTTSQTLATKITFTVGWPDNIAAVGGTGTVSIWLLSKFTGTSTLTGTSQSCGTTLPDLTLTNLGSIGAGAGGNTAKVQIQILNSTWDKISRTFVTTGTQNGFQIGNSQDTNPAVGLIGLGQSSTYATDTTTWPPYCATGKCIGSSTTGSFATSDVVDDDHDTFPGITANPLNGTDSYVYPPTNTTCGAPADQVYIVSRNEIAITGMKTACGKGTGTAKITLFDNHVVGCHAAAFQCNALSAKVPAAPCTDGQVQFLDQNRTIYGYDMSAGDTASPSHPISGTATVVQLADSATCDDVRRAIQ
jgi:hypothetical protein